MREIKFRAWNRIEKFMDSAWLIDWEHEKVCHSKHNQSDLNDCVLMQYVGEKQGQSLYVADIFQIEDSNGELFNFEIIEDGYSYSGVLLTLGKGDPVSVETGYSFGEYYHTELNIEYDDRPIPLDILFQYNCIESNGIKVIGNRYANPEMLQS